MHNWSTARPSFFLLVACWFELNVWGGSVGLQVKNHHPRSTSTWVLKIAQWTFLGSKTIFAMCVITMHARFWKGFYQLQKCAIKRRKTCFWILEMQHFERFTHASKVRRGLCHVQRFGLGAGSVDLGLSDCACDHCLKFQIKHHQHVKIAQQQLQKTAWNRAINEIEKDSI